jgi:hypothetical protein
MILDSPVSVERRGVILYEYCKDQYPEKLTEVSVAWIEAGLSLKKEHAGEIIRIKHLEAFLESEGLQLSTGYGQMDPSHRYFMLKSGDRRILFGFDSQNHQPSPVYKGEVTQRHN